MGRQNSRHAPASGASLRLVAFIAIEDSPASRGEVHASEEARIAGDVANASKLGCVVIESYPARTVVGRAIETAFSFALTGDEQRGRGASRCRLAGTQRVGDMDMRSTADQPAVT